MVSFVGVSALLLLLAAEGSSGIQHENERLLPDWTPLNNINELENGISVELQPYLATPDEQGQIRELKYFDNPRRISFSTNLMIPLMSVGSRSTGTDFGDENSIADCNQMQGVIPFPFGYRPMVHKYFKVDGKNSEVKPFRLMGEYYRKVIYSYKEEVWRCRIFSGKDQGEEFIRVVTKFQGEEQSGQISFFHTIVHATSLYRSNKEKTFLCKEIKYIHPETGVSLKFNGLLKLSPNDKNLKMDLRDMSYILQLNCIFRKVIDEKKGYDFRIGSRWQAKIGASNRKVLCTKINLNENTAFRTQIRFNIRVEDIAFSTREIENYRQSELFTYLQHKVFKCTDEKITFLRVKNVIDFRVPVREIEWYDGVGIKVIPNIGNQVRIFEVKYLDPKELFVLKYEGELEIDPEDPSEKTMGKEYDEAMYNKTYIVVPIFGGYQEKNQNLKDSVYTIQHGRQEMLLDSTATHNLSLGLDPEKELGSANDVAECFKIEGSNYDRSTAASLQADNVNEILSDKKSKYIETLSSKLWRCKVTQTKSMTYDFQRGINVAKIKKGTPHPIKYINYPNSIEMQFTMRGEKNYFIEFDEVYYTNPSGEKFVKYSGQIVEKGKEKELEGKNWLSGSMPVSGPEEEIFSKRVYYERPEQILDREYMYKTVINHGRGITLKLGSQWARMEGAQNSRIICKKLESLNEQGLNTHFKTNVEIVGETSMPINIKDVFGEFFESSKQEIRKCDPFYEGGQTFYRVVNQFLIKHDKCAFITEFLHHDGFTFLVGEPINEQAGCMEIVEVKYIDYASLEVLKYEGTIVLKDSDDQANRLKNVARKDVDYLFDEPKSSIFKRIISQSGLIVEIKDTHEEIFNPKDFQSKFKCEAMPNDHPSIPGAVKNRLASLNQEMLFSFKFKENRLEPSSMNLKDCFYYRSKVWKCQANNERSVYRVVHFFVTKRKDDTGPVVCEIARIYHPTGVTVNVLGGGKNEPSLVEIRQIKYFQDIDYKQVKFGGFVIDDIDETKDMPKVYHLVRREVRYRPELLHLHTYQGTGRTGNLEIGSPWQMTVGTHNLEASCLKPENQKYIDAYKTSIFTNLEKRNTGVKPVPDVGILSGDIKITKQDIYHCKYQKGEEVFYRVVNVLEVSNKISGIIHHGGVTVRHQTFPDGSNIRLIEEVKYVDKGTGHIMKYKGRVTIVNVVNAKVAKFFQKPSNIEENSVEKKEVESKESISPTTGTYWPMEVLRMFALKHKEELFIKEKKIEYKTTDDNKPKIHTRVIKDGKNGRILVGSPWTTELQHSAESFRCILDKWNPTTYLKFTTKVVLYINNVHYVLDEETIRNYFRISGIETWICVNKEVTILRVRTRLIGRIPIQLVEHYDGVKVKPIELEHKPGEKTVQITETKYVNATNFQVLRLNGYVKLYKGKSGKSVVTTK